MDIALDTPHSISPALRGTGIDVDLLVIGCGVIPAHVVASYLVPAQDQPAGVVLMAGVGAASNTVGQQQSSCYIHVITSSTGVKVSVIPCLYTVPLQHANDWVEQVSDMISISLLNAGSCVQQGAGGCQGPARACSIGNTGT